MKTTRSFLFLLIFAALSLRAQTPNPPFGTVVTIPAIPYANQPISVAFTLDCVFESSVQRNGNTITITPHLNPCDPPVARRNEVPIGPLPAGSYTVVVEYAGEVEATGQFQVLDANQQSFTVHPSVMPAGATTSPLQLLLETRTQYDLCVAECTVRVGGQIAQTRRTPEGLFIIPPALPAGQHDITISDALGVRTVPAAIYAFDRNASPDPVHFERILFPVLFNARGANGSDWRTEAVISNPERWYLETYNNIIPIVCIDYPCGERFSPASKARFEGGAYPRGVALIVPRREADTLAFSLRARDVSRVAETYGTEIPVVRESEFLRDIAVTLPDVPLDPRFRVRVRVYAYAVTGSATGTIVGHDLARRTKTVQTFAFSRTCSGVRECAAVPWSAEVDLFPGEQGERRNIYVSAPEGTSLWAFATVTNNKTQEVTIVRPSGTGGEPCLPCLTR